MIINNFIQNKIKPSSLITNNQSELAKTNNIADFKIYELSNSQIKAYYCPILSFKSNSKTSSPVLKAEELKHILRNELKPENFSVGENFANIKNGTFRANLHIHTTHSDGRISVSKLLDQAVKYADYRKSIGKNDPFIFAITDHSTINGSKEAIKIISQNPEKFKNIRFVSGIEFNAHHGSKQFEIIGYCLNPDDKNLQDFINGSKTKNYNYIDGLIKNNLNVFEQNYNDAQNKHSMPKFVKLTTLDDVKKLDNDLNMGDSTGFMNGFEIALNHIFKERGWKRHEGDLIDKILHEHKVNYRSLRINPGTKSVKEISDAVKKSGSGFVGIAHPSRNLINDPLNNLKEQHISELFKKIKSMGVEAIESNYQYRNNLIKFNEFYREKADKAALVSAGGQDNHRDNIFTQKYYLAELPEEVQEILGVKPIKN